MSFQFHKTRQGSVLWRTGSYQSLERWHTLVCIGVPGPHFPGVYSIHQYVGKADNNACTKHNCNGTSLVASETKRVLCLHGARNEIPSWDSQPVLQGLKPSIGEGGRSDNLGKKRMVQQTRNSGSVRSCCVHWPCSLQLSTIKPLSAELEPAVIEVSFAHMCIYILCIRVCVCKETNGGSIWTTST